MNTTRIDDKSHVRGIDINAGANDGKRIRNILIFDNHPESLRLLREVYIDSGGSILPQYYLLIIALAILGCAVVIAWFD